ncbi:Uncharacterised protein [uncultured archaeon]|nr:Uncharacterised protein [uncultured archaeon]
MSESSDLHHVLSPKPTVLTQSQIDKLISEYGLDNVYNLPKVKNTDTGLVGLSVKPGEVIKYSRTSGDYYRVVVD